MTWIDLTDEQLVELAKGGNGHAFAELSRRHRARCHKQALAILRDPHLAEDEVQNAFAKAFENLQGFEGTALFSTWLTRIVVNQCLMRLRKEKRERLYYFADAAESDTSAGFEPADQRLTPEEELGRFQVRELVRREITRIPPLFRTVIELRDLRSLPMPEVAGRLGISLAAAKSRLLRARAELRGRMLKHCGTLGLATLAR